ncbi:hypothetical protein P389DRAFT_190477 [Cystobasidium minutum MCA 4210]|uniref:uncharacterized protein n=1 Tax=Cystobasidium minutum MCA 4210 TaxID=1397322 RepID=UPI0034CD3F1F|eukprot:jgi/Rhomi1/190477/estExt_fgenesh1_pg.C_5_t10271
MTAQTVQGYSDRNLYNDGNDEIASMNRFAFPSISFSPSFPMNLSPSSPLRTPSNAIPALSPPSSAFNVLSPRSAHRGGGGLFGTATGGGILLSPGIGSSISPANQLPSYFSPPSPNGSGSLLSVLSASLESPLPPLSPRGQKLADAESYHNAKCLNRIVEKRRKVSDGTADIVAQDRPPLFISHSRRVSFQVSKLDAEKARCDLMADTVPDGSTTSPENSPPTVKVSTPE